ncbi:MAG: ABC transporter permease [Terriglobales bacterium]
MGVINVVGQDLLYLWRQLRRAPGFATVAIVALALGIGANTAIFSVIHAVLIQPLPFPHPEQLVWLREDMGFPGPFTGPDFVAWRQRNHSLQGMTLFDAASYNLSGGGPPQFIAGLDTAANFFSLLGARPLLGRTFAPGEDQPGHDHVVVISYGLWQSHFAGRRAALGQPLELNGRAYTVIGVMPRGFDFFGHFRLWAPEDMSRKALEAAGAHQFLVVGRLRPGVTVAQAQADLGLIARELSRQHPDTNTNVRAAVFPLHRIMVGGIRDSLLMMLAAVGLVLLIACANVANLLLARAAARQKEIAVRSALGASRGRLIRQLLTESIALALAGGALGVGLAEIGVRALAATRAAFRLPPPNPIQLDGTVLAFTFGLAVVTGVLFGLAPAWQLSRPEASDELKGAAGGGASAGRHRRRLSDALVVAEICLSLVLLAGAGLLIRSLGHLRSTHIGVRENGVFTARVSMPQARFSQPQAVVSFSRDWLGRVRALPGVTAAAITDHLPMEGGTNGTITLFGHPTNHNSAGQLVEMHGITPGYFQVMGIRLLQGRGLDAGDTDRARRLDSAMLPYMTTSAQPRAALTRSMVYPVDVNEAMVRHYWPNLDPIGQRFSYWGADGPWMQVVGVVSNVRQWGVEHVAIPEEYQPFDGAGYGGTILVLHTTLPPAVQVAPLRRTLAQVDASLPLFATQTLRQVLDRLTGMAELQAGLLGAFAALALLLAAVGIYGVMSYAVTQRRRDIGIRIALGAQRRQVLGLVVRQGLVLALIGVASGIAGALAAGRLLASLLYQVRPSDPLILAGAAVALLAVALAACWLPARRAAAVDPVLALRQE